MAILHEIRKALNQKSVMRNILFCLTIIILMHLLYGVYRSTQTLREGGKGGKRRNNGKKCKKLSRKLKKLVKRKVKKGKGKKNIKLDKKINKTKRKMIKHKCVSGAGTGGAGTGGAGTGGATPPECKVVGDGNPMNGENYDQYVNGPLDKCNVTSIGSFKDFKGDVEINGDDYPNLEKLENIGESAFKNVIGDITFDGTFPKLKNIGESAFKNVIGDITFDGTFPKLEKIEREAFQNVRGNITFKGDFSNLTTIKNSAFDSVIGDITFDGTFTMFNIIENLAFNRVNNRENYEFIVGDLIQGRAYGSTKQFKIIEVSTDGTVVAEVVNDGGGRGGLGGVGEQWACGGSGAHASAVCWEHFSLLPATIIFKGEGFDSVQLKEVAEDRRWMKIGSLGGPFNDANVKIMLNEQEVYTWAPRTVKQKRDTIIIYQATRGSMVALPSMKTKFGRTSGVDVRERATVVEKKENALRKSPNSLP